MFSRKVPIFIKMAAILDVAGILNCAIMKIFM